MEKVYKLTDAEANLLLNALAEVPYKVSAGLIKKLQDQYQMQTVKPEATADLNPDN